MRGFIIAIIIAIVAASIALPARAQLTDEEQARVVAAMEMADNGRADKAVETLAKICEAHPAEAALRYELGYAQMKDYKFGLAAETFRTLRGEMGDVAYQMEGNALDMAGRRADALRTYREGLGAFPLSGRLRMELGTIRLQEEDYDGALEMYESGIESEPGFASNYYRVAWVLFNSSAPWEGMAYAEAFIVMERKGARVEEMSRMLYEACAATLRNDAAHGGSAMTRAAAETGYEPAADGDRPSLRALAAAMRAMSAEDEAEEADATLARVVRFEAAVREAGHWDAYCRWLLRKGAEEEFAAWMSLHADMMERFALWLAENGGIAG